MTLSEQLLALIEIKREFNEMIVAAGTAIVAQFTAMPASPEKARVVNAWNVGTERLNLWSPEITGAIESMTARAPVVVPPPTRIEITQPETLQLSDFRGNISIRNDQYLGPGPMKVELVSDDGTETDRVNVLIDWHDSGKGIDLTTKGLPMAFLGDSLIQIRKVPL